MGINMMQLQDVMDKRISAELVTTELSPWDSPWGFHHP